MTWLQRGGTAVFWDPAPPATTAVDKLPPRHILAVNPPEEPTFYLDTQFVEENEFVLLKDDSINYASPTNEHNQKFLLTRPIPPPQSLADFQKIWDSVHSGATLNYPDQLARSV